MRGKLRIAHVDGAECSCGENLQGVYILSVTAPVAIKADIALIKSICVVVFVIISYSANLIPQYLPIYRAAHFSHTISGPSAQTP